jgi:hypothetical protein
MLKFLDKLSYSILIVAASWMLIAPIQPMPHVAEKILMLKAGTLQKPIDIFDLFFHLSPLVLLVLKVIRDRR